MLKFKRPSGSTITVGNTEANIEYADANKWELIKSVKVAAPKAEKEPAKEEKVAAPPPAAAE